MTFTPRTLVFVLSALAFHSTWARDLGPFFDKHCVDCHGPDKQKAGLRLDTLKADFDTPKSAATWTKVYDKLATGEMPPKKSERPPQAELEATTAYLRENLHAASLARQQKEGRVIVRRLNGTEYENTLHDLLGTNVPLKEMLPEDGSAGGFDTVSTALDVSSTHLLLYQEAAAKAIASTIPVGPPMPFSDRRTAEMMVKKGSNFQQTLGRSAKMQGDALIFYSKLPRYGLCSTASVKMAGRYKVTLSACTVGGDG